MIKGRWPNTVPSRARSPQQELLKVCTKKPKASYFSALHSLYSVFESSTQKKISVFDLVKRLFSSCWKSASSVVKPFENIFELITITGCQCCHFIFLWSHTVIPFNGAFLGRLLCSKQQTCLELDHLIAFGETRNSNPRCCHAAATSSPPVLEPAEVHENVY